MYIHTYTKHIFVCMFTYITKEEKKLFKDGNKQKKKRGGEGQFKAKAK